MTANFINQFVEYLTIERGMSELTVENYANDIRQFIKFTNKKITAVNTKDILKFIHHLRNKGMTASTTNRKLSSIKAFFKFLKKIKVVENNPADTIETSKIEERLPRPFTKTEVMRLLDAANTLREKAVLHILYGTGIRRSELAKIKIDDIDFETGLIRIKGKGSRERLVPIHKNGLNAIKEYARVARSEWLFPSPMNPETHITERQINNIIRQIGKRAGVNNTTPHRFRHSFVSHLYDAGADIKTISDLVGHKSLSTTQAYAKVSLNRVIKDYNTHHPIASAKNVE